MAFEKITPIGHYSIENPATLYDEEATTALKLAARTAAKANQISEIVNEHGDFIIQKEREHDAAITKMINEQLPYEVDNEVQEHIDSGDFDNQISKYSRNLSQRVDNLLGTLTTGSTTGDAELIDIRTTVNGVVYPSAGNAVRSIGSDVNELRVGRYNIKYALDWDLGKGMTVNGEIHSNVAPNTYAVAHKTFPKDTKIEYQLYTTVNSGTVAIGDEIAPVSCIRVGNELGTPTTGSYIVQNDFETVWFMTDTAYIGDCIIAVSQTHDQILHWNKGYIKGDGTIDNSSAVYHYSDLIFLPAMHRISFTGQASNSVATISLYDSTGVWKGMCAQGVNAVQRSEYEFASGVDCYVRICSSVQTREPESTYVNNTNIKIEPYTQKYRVPYFNVGNGHISATRNIVVNDSVYKYSNFIRLWPGETIRFKACGSTGMYMLSEWGYNNTLADSTQHLYFIEGIKAGDDRLHIVDYTNERDSIMYVRISSKIAPTYLNNTTTNEEDFTDVKLFFKDVYYADVKDHPLYGKTLAFIGDSLCYGNHHGNGATWAENLRVKYNMIHNNYGINGNPVAGTAENPMVGRYTAITAADYIVLIGGANDLRLNVPIDTFKTDLNTIIDGLRSMHPKAKLLFLTNMNRYGGANDIGHKEVDYVDAMIEVCAEKGVRCFDNYRNLGIYFRDMNQAAWADEGRVQGIKFNEGIDDVANGNRHLSPEGYAWITPVYEQLLTGL